MCDTTFNNHLAQNLSRTKGKSPPLRRLLLHVAISAEQVIDTLRFDNHFARFFAAKKRS